MRPLKMDKNIVALSGEGYRIARDYLTPALEKIEDDNGFSKYTMAMACMICAYAALRGKKNSPQDKEKSVKAVKLFRELGKMAIVVVEKRKPVTRH